jgi:hypothetical protein
MLVQKFVRKMLMKLTHLVPSHVSISSTFYKHIFRMNLAAFSSYVLVLAKNLYKKCVRKMLMKSTASHSLR